MVLDVVLIVVTLVALFIASYTDLRTREVPDWLNYGLIFAGLGIRGIFAIVYEADIFLTGLLGLVVCLGLAYFLYYTHQWGGGDSKLLMGMGVIIGIQYPFNSGSFTILWFFLALLFLGAIYGMFWMGYIAIRRRKVFVGKFMGKLKEYKKVQFILLLVTIGLFVISLGYHAVGAIAAFPAAIFYLVVFVNTVEESCFLRQIKPKRLTEGDWLAEDVKVRGKKVLLKKTLNFNDLKTLRILQRQGKIKTVLIKEGIPFVPSFLFAYFAILLVKDFSGLILSWI
jgi:Flp pilus assembly protein protease CpaA